MQITEADIQFITELIDDEDIVVRQSVDQRLQEGGRDAIMMLLRAADKPCNKTKSDIIRQKAMQLNLRIILDRLSDYAHLSSMVDSTLLEGAYLVSAAFCPSLERGMFYSMLMPLIADVMSETNELKTSIENVTILNHIFYNRFGFKCSDPFNMSIENAMLLNTLTGKCGSPFAVSLIYFIVAQAANLPIYPVCFSGGFIPACAEDDKILFYINIFHQGEIFKENSVKNLLKDQIQMMGVTIGDFEIKKDDSVLVIYLEYLQMICSNSSEKEMEQIIESMLQVLSPNRFLSVEEDDE